MSALGVYPTNEIESLNMPIRKVIKTRGHFPSDEAVGDRLNLALRSIGKRWKAKLDKSRRAVFLHPKLLFGERLVATS